MKQTLLLPFFVLLFMISVAQTPTWTNQVSCVLFSHCTSCHNPNGLAPFSLLSYSDAYAKRFNIANSVSARTMPPYLPDLTYSRFAHERVLSIDEITLINAWVAGGAPAGDTTLTPPAPVYNSTEQITSPDMVGRIPTFTVPNVNYDLYQAFIITNPSPSVKYISQLEVVPGNRNIVHHVLVFQDTTNSPVINDSSFAGPGYVSFGGIGSAKAELISGWVPGSGLYELPAGMGIKLHAGARIVVQIHYPTGSAGLVDSTKLNFKFSTTPLRNVSMDPALNTGNMTNGPLIIPPNSVKTFYSKYTVPVNVTIVSIAPHAHLVCTKFEVFGVTPASDTIRLIRINDWDFHWQGAHFFQKPIKLPAGTVLNSIAVYDNTANNPHNPNSPPQLVTGGEATNDEMMLIYFGYLLYQAGDENIVVDTASHMKHYLDCEPENLVSNLLTESMTENELDITPNPFSDAFTLTSSSILPIEIFDVTGRKINETYTTTTNNVLIHTSDWQSGLYILKQGDTVFKILKY